MTIAAFDFKSQMRGEAIAETRKARVVDLVGPDDETRRIEKPLADRRIESIGHRRSLVATDVDGAIPTEHLGAGARRRENRRDCRSGQ